MAARRPTGSGGGRIVYLDYLRALMPFAIIMVHVLESTDWMPDRYSSSYFLVCAIMRICRIGVPMFCMISGALFLNPKRPFNYKKHFTKTIPRIIIAYVVWSLFYAAIQAFLSDGNSHERFMVFLNNAFTGYWHLWYLKMLAVAYLLVPLMRKIAENKNLLSYTMMIIVFTMTVWTASSLLETLVQARGSEGLLKAFLSNFNGSIGSSVEYFGVSIVSFFFVGGFLASREFTKKQRIYAYILGAAGLIMAIVFPALRTRIMNDDFAFRQSGFDDIGTFVYICAVFIFVKEALRKKASVNKLIAFMAKHSFGIYLTHVSLLMVVSHYCIIPAWHGWSILVVAPGSVLILYLFGLAVSWIFSKIPFLRRVV